MRCKRPDFTRRAELQLRLVLAAIAIALPASRGAATQTHSSSEKLGFTSGWFQATYGAKVPRACRLASEGTCPSYRVRR